jgi:hypothetical protein
MEDPDHDRVVVQCHNRARKPGQELTICGIAVDEPHDRVEVEPVLGCDRGLLCLALAPTAVMGPQGSARAFTCILLEIAVDQRSRAGRLV